MEASLGSVGEQGRLIIALVSLSSSLSTSFCYINHVHHPSAHTYTHACARVLRNVLVRPERLWPDDGGHDLFRSLSSSLTTTSPTWRRRGDANSGRASRLPLCRCRHLASRTNYVHASTNCRTDEPNTSEIYELFEKHNFNDYLI